MSKRNKRRTCALLLAGCLAAVPALAGDSAKGFSIGLQGSPQASLGDIGLPAYPGATPYSENEGDQSAFTLGAWAGSVGLRISALKYQVADAPILVAAFYAKALGRHGAVLDCREPAARIKPPKDSDKLSCDEAAPPSGEYEFRAGTGKQFRVVHVRPHGSGARFEVVRISFGN